MTVQFDRRVEVQVDTLDVSGLHVAFRVTKTTKKEPNTCELTIFNLSKSSRETIAQLANPTVQIKAGYFGRDEQDDVQASVDAALGGGGASDRGFGLIFLGDLRDAHSSKEPPNWVTTLESGDGEKSTRFSRINKSFASGTNLATVMTEVSKSMGVGIGNAAKKAQSGNLLEAGKEFLNGITMSGQSSKELDRIVKSAGLEWSIQDGALQLLDPGKPLEDVSVVLKPGTGLIGSPTIGNDGVIKLRSLLNADIVPGRQIDVTSRVLSGQGTGVTGTGRFRAERVEYIGSNFDRDYYCDIEAKEL